MAVLSKTDSVVCDIITELSDALMVLGCPRAPREDSSTLLGFSIDFNDSKLIDELDVATISSAASSLF